MTTQSASVMPMGMSLPGFFTCRQAGTGKSRSCRVLHSWRARLQPTLHHWACCRRRADAEPMRGASLVVRDLSQLYHASCHETCEFMDSKVLQHAGVDCGECSRVRGGVAIGPCHSACWQDVSARVPKEGRSAHTSSAVVAMASKPM